MPGNATPELGHIVRTSAFTRVESAAERVLKCHGVMVVDGKHGVGKTTIIDDVARRHHGSVAVLSLPPRQSSRDVVRDLHAALAVGDEADALTELDLQDDLVRILADSHLVVVRNVERMTKEVAGQLQWLHEQAGGWTLLLEGGPSAAAAVERDALLSGRVRGTVTVPPLHGDELLRTLHDLHPMFLGADTDLLVETDTRVCHGLLRHWSVFLEVALYLRRLAVSQGRPEPVLNRKLAKAVLAELPTTIVRKRS